MKLGLHIPSFTWPGGPPTIGADLARVAQAAETAGFDRVSVMDHVFQIEMRGPAEDAMLEATTTLGYLAGVTSRVRLLALVHGVTYRDPGLLAKAVTTLDVLSGGRAMLGIGAAWYEAEARALGLNFPPLAERFERLEETILICLQMWRGDEGAFHSRHFDLERTLNSPQSLTRPHPPILIGGSGEQKTLRLVARYAQACNLFANADLAHKLDVLRSHCEAEGRDYDEIEKTVLYNFDPGPHGERVAEIVEQLGAFAELGFSVAHGSVENPTSIEPFELLADIVPVVAAL